MPKATVLMPTYNCAKYIKEALVSISEQKYKDYEILIIDDGSTDNTEEIVNGIALKNLRYIKNEKNLGIVDSLNFGIDIINSPYIVRMDADDIMLGNRLNDQIRFLDSNPGFGMVGSWYHIINEQGIITKSLQLNTDFKFLNLVLIFSNMFGHSSVTMRTELAKQLYYDKAFQYCEDHDLWLRFSKISKITNLPTYNLAYRWHSNNTCSQKQKELKIAVLNLLSRELDELEISHTPEELMLHGAVCFGVGRAFYKHPVRRKNIDDWHDKIFNSKIIQQQYNKEWLNNFRRNLLRIFCG